MTSLYTTATTLDALTTAGEQLSAAAPSTSACPAPESALKPAGWSSNPPTTRNCSAYPADTSNDSPCSDPSGSAPAPAHGH